MSNRDITESNKEITESRQELAEKLEEKRDVIKRTIAKDANNDELEMFMYLAKQYNLDPFMDEIYFWKFGNDPTIMTSRDGYLKIANQNPHYEGIISDVIYQNDTFTKNGPDIADIKHSYNVKNRGKIVGAYAFVYRDDRKFPVYVYAPFNEYNKSNKIWNGYSSAMIKKVAESQALKRAFSVSGLVAKEEMDMNESGNNQNKSFTFGDSSGGKDRGKPQKKPEKQTDEEITEQYTSHDDRSDNQTPPEQEEPEEEVHDVEYEEVNEEEEVEEKDYTLEELANIKINFGKHKGKTLGEIPEGYVEYIAENAYDEELKVLAGKYLQRKEKPAKNDSEPSDRQLEVQEICNNKAERVEATQLRQEFANRYDEDFISVDDMNQKTYLQYIKELKELLADIREEDINPDEYEGPEISGAKEGDVDLSDEEVQELFDNM